MRWLWIVLFTLGCSETSFHNIGQPSPTPGETEPEPTVEVETCEVSTEIAAVERWKPVDILWAIDTSPSMWNEKAMIRDNLNQFSQHILDAGLDTNVVVLAESSSEDGICVDAPLGSGSCPNDHNPPRLFRDYITVGNHDALSRLIHQWPNYHSVIRDNSVKYYAVVTDDHSSAWPVQTFIDHRDSLDPNGAEHWSFYGFFCKSKDEGNIYQGLVDATGGTHVELCGSAPDWTVVFDQMVNTILENKVVECDMAIPAAPEGATFDSEQLNLDYHPGVGGEAFRLYNVQDSEACGEEGGWYYDDNTQPTRLILCEASCNEVENDFDGHFEVWFDCLTETQP